MEGALGRSNWMKGTERAVKEGRKVSDGEVLTDAGPDTALSGW